MNTTTIFVGIDVSKAQLDLAIRPRDETAALPNDLAGIEAVITRLRPLKPALVVLEATGGLERGVVRALVAATFPVIVVNPRQVREFARATGQLAKTDRLDARVLARFAEVVRPPPAGTTGPADRGVECASGSTAPTDREAHGRKESPSHGAQACPETDHGPYHLAGRRTGTGGQQRGCGDPAESGLAGPRRSAAQCARHRPRPQSHPLGQTAGVGAPEPQADRGLGRGRPAESR